MLVLIMKLIAVPIGVWLGDAMLGDVNYPFATSIVLTGLVLAIIGYAVEWLVLRRGTVWLTTVLDWGLSAAVIYMSQFAVRGAYVSITGALLTGGILAIGEYFMHRYAVSRGALATRI